MTNTKAHVINDEKMNEYLFLFVVASAHFFSLFFSFEGGLHLHRKTQQKKKN